MTGRETTMDQTRALDNLRSLAFALQECVLYLDGHPDNDRALAFYRDCMRRYAEAMAQYESQWGPITVLGTSDASGDGWQWVKQPWPWEWDKMEAYEAARDRERNDRNTAGRN